MSLQPILSTLRSAARLALVAAVALSVGGALRSEETQPALQEGAKPARVLRFPPQRPAGLVYIQDEGYRTPIHPGTWLTHDISLYRDWKFLAEAVGDVHVPAGKRVHLVIRPQGWIGASPLAKLRPDDLYMISTPGIGAQVREPSGPDKVYERIGPHIARMTGLRVLYWVHGQDVRTRSVKFLRSLRSLEALWVSSVGDAHLAEIGTLKQLKRLYIEGADNHFTDAGWAQLASLDALEELSISMNGPVQDAGFTHASKVKSLRYLQLFGERFTDAGAAHLKDCRSLKTLVLVQARVTDAGLVHVSSLREL